MNDEQREKEHLRPFFLVNKELFLTRYERDPKLSNLHTAATSQELRLVWKTEPSAKFIYQKGILIDEFDISAPPIVVVVQVDNAVCALLPRVLLLSLHVGGARGVQSHPLHHGQHPPDSTQEVQAGHNRNTQPGKEQVCYQHLAPPRKSGEQKAKYFSSLNSTRNKIQDCRTVSGAECQNIPKLNFSYSTRKTD